MKTLLFIFIGCLSLLMSGYSFSCGSSCGDSSSCQGGCSGSESQNSCQCADVNSGKNPCISKTDYCRLFGNVGDNKLSDF